MKNTAGKLSLILLVLLLTASALNVVQASADNKLPESFSEYGWLLYGAKEVVSKNTEFAPVTTCFDLNKKFAGNKTSSIQKEREWEKYQDKLIPLTGIVEEVKRIPITNDYLAFFKCVNSESFMVDFTVEIPKEMEEYAFELTPGDRREVYVRLTDYGEMMGVSTQLDTFQIDKKNGETCFSYLNIMIRESDEFEYGCYGGEHETGFANLVSESGSSQIVGGMQKDGIAVAFYILPENPERYMTMIKTNKNVTLHFSGNKNICKIESSQVKENSEWLSDTYKKLGSEILNTEGIESINEWYIKSQALIDSLSEKDYSCKEKQIIRFFIYNLYQRAKDDGGVESISNLANNFNSKRN